MNILVNEYSFNINICNNSDESPLSYWLLNRHLKNTTRLLEQYKADPNYQHPLSLRCGLHFSVNSSDSSINASFELESILISNGANINIKDKKGRNCLFYAFRKIN